MLALVTIATGAWAVNLNVRIGGVMVTSDNYTNITADNGFTAIKSGTVTYNYRLKILTLNNAVIETDEGTSSLRILDSGNFTLSLKGENKIIQNASSDDYAGLDALNLTISGSGSLTIESPNAHGIFIDQQKTLTIDNTTLNVQAGRTGITSYQQKTEKLVINSSFVTVTGAQGSICDLGSLTLTDCGIASPSGAAFSGGAVKVNGATVIEKVVIQPPVPINATYFPDDDFRSYISEQIDTNNDGALSIEEIAATTYIKFYNHPNTTTLKGIEFFTALTKLSCYSNGLTELDLTNNKALKSVFCPVNQLTSLKVTGLTSLESLSCSDNQLTSLSVSNLTALKNLYCNNNRLSNIYVENCEALTWINCYNNRLLNLPVTRLIRDLPEHTTTSTLIYCSTSSDEENRVLSEAQICQFNDKNWKVYKADGNDKVELTVSGIYVGKSNFPDQIFRNYIFGKIDKDGNKILSESEILACTDLSLTNMGISDLTGIEYFTALTHLRAGSNNLTSLNLSKNTNLEYLYCQKNQLTELAIANNKRLKNISCFENRIGTTAMNDLFIALPSVEQGEIIAFSDASTEHNAQCTADMLRLAKRKHWTVKYFSNGTYNTQELQTVINSSSFPDAYFRYYVSQNIDTNHDGILTDAEAAAVRTLDLSNKDITDLSGIDFFPNLISLWCQNNKLTFLDVSANTKLSMLQCQNNKLQMIVIEGTDLYDLQCYGNQIKSTAMESLINSLPTNRTARMGYLTTTTGNEGNDRVTAEQITTARERGWYVFTSDGTNTTLVNVPKAVQINSMNFPDANFRNYVSKEIDKDCDDILSPEELMKTLSINVNNKEIASLKGIEYFINLEKLQCNGNNLTELDISKNTYLTLLSCDRNQLTSIDLSHNLMLKQFAILNNQLTNIDLSHNTALKSIHVGNNQLMSLDLSHNPLLESLHCSYNHLTALDFSHNPLVTYIDCSNNSIHDEASDAFIQSLPSVTKGTIVLLMNYSTSEGNHMTPLQIHRARQIGWKVQWFPHSILLMPLEDVDINATYFPDANFRDFVIANYDKNHNYVLESSEYSNVTSMDISGKGISNLTGLGFFSNLEKLDCHNNNLTKLDLSYFYYLTEVKCYQNKIKGDGMSALFDNLLSAYGENKPSLIIRYSDTSENNSTPTQDQIIVAHNKNWQVFTFDGSDYNTMDTPKIAINSTNFPDTNFRDYVRQYIDTDGDGFLSYQEIKEVTMIMVYGMNISSLKGVEYFTELQTLFCNNNNLTTLDVSQNKKLYQLDCYDNQLTQLILNNPALGVLRCFNNKLTALNLSNSPELFNFSCRNNRLTSLDLSNCPEIFDLNCAKNTLYSIDLSNNVKLKSLALSDNSLTTLNLSKNVLLTNLYCSNNLLSQLDLSKNKLLKQVECYSNRIAASKMSLLVENLPTVSNGLLVPVDYNDPDEQNVITTQQADIANAKGWSVISNDEMENEIKTKIDVAHFPDQNFRNYVSENFDTDGDGYLSRSEALMVEEIDVREMAINDLTGIEYFTELKQLICLNDFVESSTDNHLTTLDLSKNTKLTRVACGQNHTLSSLNISKCTELGNLHCANNNLTTLDVSNCPKLWRLHCNNNKLTSLDLSYNQLLENLNCQITNITSLSLLNHPQLKNLYLYDIPLKTLDLSGCTALDDLGVGGTQLTSLDISTNTTLTILHVGGNSRLKSLDLSNNTALKEFYWNNNTAMALPNLSKNTALKKLYIYDSSNLISITLPTLPALNYLAVYDNERLTSLRFSSCTALDTLYCYNNQLTSLNLSSCQKLKYLSCFSNQLTQLDVSNNPDLTTLLCYNNELTSLDLSHNDALTFLNCAKNKISSLVLSPNAQNLKTIYCNNNRLSGGKAIDDMIASLPNRTNSSGYIYFKDKDNYYEFEEHNYCTPEQVAAAQAKNWVFGQLEEEDDGGELYYYWNYYNGESSIRGDVNGDNNVDISDVVALVNIILNGNSDYQAAADVNNDGGIDISDVVALVNIILGQ